MLRYACCSVDFPHISVGCRFGNHWHLFSAPSPFLCRRLWFPKLHSVSLSTLWPWQNQFQSVRLFSGSNACPALYTMNQRSSVDGLGFPPAHGPDRGQRRSTWAPKHIKITHPLATLLKSKWYECRMVQPSNSCDFDTWYLLLEPCHKERSCWRHTPPNIMQTPLKEVGMITTRFKKNNTAQTKMSFLMCLDLSASSLSCSPFMAALGTEAVPFHSELGLVWDWLGWLGSLFEWKMIPFNLYSFGAYFPNILGWDWLGWFGIFIWIKDPSSLYSCGAYFPNILGWDWLKDPSSL